MLAGVWHARSAVPWNRNLATRGVVRHQTTPEVFQRLAELHELIVESENEVANLKQE